MSTTVRTPPPIQVTVYMDRMRCSECKIHWAADREWVERRRDDGHTFYCPNGHTQCFRETEADRLRKDKERLERWLANTNESARSTHATLEIERRKHAATKGQLTKTRKRAAAAVCPVDGCQRHFVQMERHLRAKHPDYTPPAS